MKQTLTGVVEAGEPLIQQPSMRSGATKLPRTPANQRQKSNACAWRPNHSIRLSLSISCGRLADLHARCTER